MGIIDLLKDIPLSAVLKEKITGLEFDNSALKTENESLKIKLSQSEEQRGALKKQLSEIHNNPFKFDDKTGTFVSSADGMRYCAKCKSKNNLSPLKNGAYGWECPVCDSKFSDPARPRSIGVSLSRG